jgi:hypothetical protein
MDYRFPYSDLALENSFFVDVKYKVYDVKYKAPVRERRGPYQSPHINPLLSEMITN